MILFCDFDGTLFRRNIEGDFEKNLEAVRRFRAAGHKFVMTTGRSPSSLAEVLPNYAELFDYTIGDNGSVCLGPEGINFEITIPDDEQDEITAFARSLPYGDQFDFVYDRGCHGHPDIDGGATKIRIWTLNKEIMDATMARLKEHFGDKYVILGMSSAKPSLPFIHEGHSAAINFMAKEAGKEKALVRIAEKLEEPLFAVGDGGNDLAMLQMYDGYIMRTARDELTAQFGEDRKMDSVSDLIDRMLVFEDIYKKIGVDLSRERATVYTDGATQSSVFSIKDKYLIKITSRMTVRTQSEFLQKVQHPAFQKLLCYDVDLHYECYEFIKGVHYKDAPLEAREAVLQIANIVEGYPRYDCDGYGFLEDEKTSWREFLLDEIEYAQERIPEVSQERVLRALVVAGQYTPEKYLMHGDFGAHNFLTDNGKIRVIDPMPMVGDRLYDFYFAVLSNTKIFAELGLDYILSFFEGYDVEYRKALITIALYVRTSRAAVYDTANLDKYIELYNSSFLTSS